MRAVQIQPAGSRELRLIERWLPQAFLGSPPARFFSATESGGRVVGAASLRLLGEQARFLLFVESDCRRHGVGTALFNTVRQSAIAAGAAELLAGRSLDGDDPQQQFCTSVGLQPKQKRSRFEIHTVAALNTYGPAGRRLEQTGRAPEVFHIGSLDPSKFRQLASFASQQVGGFVDAYLARLRSGEYCTQTSLAARQAGIFTGLLLARQEPDMMTVDLIAVAPQFRTGRLSTMSKYRFVQLLVQHGRPQFAFEADPVRAPDTAKLARRCGGRVTTTRILYGEDLP